jgi:sugar transferase EpsL
MSKVAQRLAVVLPLKVAPDNPCIPVLRRSGLDELPNFWNVVRGDIALIGPRPEQVALLGYYQRWQQLRHLAKPGITGWWQIHHRDSVPMHLNVERDTYYVRNQTPGLDLRILLDILTVLVQPLVSRQRPTANRLTGQILDPAELARIADGSRTRD